MAHVSLRGLTKDYPDGFRAVDSLDLEIRDGEFLVMVGPSGCGKSTTLRMVAGLEPITSGETHLDGKDVTQATPKQRDVAMVFQNYALYPHMTVAENIEYPLKVAKVPKGERMERISEAARLLRLTGELEKRPNQLSGGQRQRVAMGRALIRRPQLFLLDEPLSNLDAKLRVQMRGSITTLQRDLGVTTFYVTHDQVEAMTMADRVAVMHKGVLQQVAPPQVLFDEPRNLFVAAFIGSPSMNLVTVRIERRDEQMWARAGSLLLPIPPEIVESRPRLDEYENKKVGLGLRPKDLEDASLARDYQASHVVTVRVDAVEALGSERIVHFNLDAPPVASAGALDDVDDETRKFMEDQTVTQVTGRFDPESRIKAGSEAAIAIDMHHAHFFDLETGLAITT